LSDYNPYHAYVEGSVSSQHPVRLVVALYEGALEATRNAGRCLEKGDIWGRSKAVNKALAILTELLLSLDYEKGGEISLSLKRLYGYMQTKLIEAHARQTAEPLREVETLLGTLAEGWSVASQGLPSEEYETRESVLNEEAEAVPYGAYWSEPVDAVSGAAFSF
jgi:flagellar secretion chaperone FliS